MNMNLWDTEEMEGEEVEETQARLNASQNVVSDLKSSNWVRLISVQCFVFKSLGHSGDFGNAAKMVGKMSKSVMQLISIGF